jgi:LysR family transcriptional regulator, hydrogen peroxide-inducible genes activator
VPRLAAVAQRAARAGRGAPLREGAKRVLVTAAGRELVERAERLLLEADDIVRAAQRVADPLSGTIRLGVIPTISPYLLPSVTPALRRKLPS